MISEILFAAYEIREPQFDRIPALSVSGLHPCPYRMYKTHIGEMFSEEITPQQILNMDDGWTAEEQAVKRLAKAGIIVRNREPDERRVKIGKTDIPGSFDGTIDLDIQSYLWEFKAMNRDRFSEFQRWGISHFIGYKAQYNGYLVGANLRKCIFQVKNKDNNDYYDTVEELDEDFIYPIIEDADKVRNGWIPEPKECGWCVGCGLGCFGEALDFSWITNAKAPEIVEKWKHGKIMKAAGELAMEEAKAFFVGVRDKEGNVIVQGLIGDKEVLFIEDLKIQKIIQHRVDIKRDRILKEFGPEGLLKVADFNEIEFYRIMEV